MCPWGCAVCWSLLAGEMGECAMAEYARTLRGRSACRWGKSDRAGSGPHVISAQGTQHLGIATWLLQGGRCWDRQWSGTAWSQKRERGEVVTVTKSEEALYSGLVSSCCGRCMTFPCESLNVLVQPLELQSGLLSTRSVTSWEGT